MEGKWKRVSVSWLYRAISLEERKLSGEVPSRDPKAAIEARLDQFLEVLNKKQEDTADEAQQAFWAVVARRHKDVKTGDFPPDATFAFDSACEDAVREWMRGNVD